CMKHIPSKGLSETNLNPLLFPKIIPYLNPVIGTLERRGNFVSITILIIAKIAETKVDVHIILLRHIFYIGKSGYGISVVLATKVCLTVVALFLFFHFLGHQIDDAAKSGAIPKGIGALDHFNTLYLLW